MIIRSEISASYKRKKLMKGFFSSLLGFAILFTSSIYFSVEELKQFGLIIVVFSFLLIRFGLKDYKKLLKKEKYPTSLCFSKEALIFSFQGKGQFLLPMRLISSVKYVQTAKEYGIAISLSVPWNENLLLKNPKFPISRYHKKAKAYRADLFFPFFTKSACKELKRELSLKPALHNIMHADDPKNL